MWGTTFLQLPVVSSYMAATGWGWPSKCQKTHGLHEVKDHVNYPEPTKSLEYFNILGNANDNYDGLISKSFPVEKLKSPRTFCFC